MKQHRLFTAKVVVPSKSILVLKDCVLVENKVGQKWRGGVRPLIFFKLSNDEFLPLLNELCKSKGLLNRDNYKVFLPFMLSNGFTKYKNQGYVLLDLEETIAVRDSYAKRNNWR